MRLRVLLFAGLRQALGSSEIFLQAPLPETVRDLEARLRSAFPDLAEASFRVAVDDAFALGDLRLQPQNEIALIPPVSGG